MKERSTNEEIANKYLEDSPKILASAKVYVAAASAYGTLHIAYNNLQVASNELNVWQQLNEKTREFEKEIQGNEPALGKLKQMNGIQDQLLNDGVSKVA